MVGIQTRCSLISLERVECSGGGYRNDGKGDPRKGGGGDLFSRLYAHIPGHHSLSNSISVFFTGVFFFYFSFCDTINPSTDIIICSINNRIHDRR